MCERVCLKAGNGFGDILTFSADEDRAEGRSRCWTFHWIMGHIRMRQNSRRKFLPFDDAEADLSRKKVKNREK